MSATTKYGLIGAGMMGQEHIRNIALLDNTNIAAIFEPDAAMRAAAAEFAANAVFTGSVDELLAMTDLSCLVITSPNYLHVAQLEQIAAKRTLPILLEKLLYTTPDDAKRIAALRDSYDAPIWVAKEYHCMPPVAELVKQAGDVTGGAKMPIIREDRFPFLEEVCDWNRLNEKSGGTLGVKCCHFFDLVRLILKSDPVRIMASGGQAVNHLDEVYDGKKSEIWDNSYVIVDFASGARHVGTVHVSRGRSLSGGNQRRRAQGQDRMSGSRTGPVLACPSGRAASGAVDRQPARSQGTGGTGHSGRPDPSGRQ